MKMSIVLQDIPKKLLCIHGLRWSNAEGMTDTVGTGIEHTLIPNRAMLIQNVPDGAGILIVEFHHLREQCLITFPARRIDRVTQGNFAIQFDHGSACHHVSKPLSTG